MTAVVWDTLTAENQLSCSVASRAYVTGALWLIAWCLSAEDTTEVDVHQKVLTENAELCVRDRKLF